MVLVTPPSPWTLESSYPSARRHCLYVFLVDASPLFSYIYLALNIKTIFRTLISFFSQQGIEYALVGAFALKAYGYLRATQDSEKGQIFNIT